MRVKQALLAVMQKDIRGWFLNEPSVETFGPRYVEEQPKSLSEIATLQSETEIDNEIERLFRNIMLHFKKHTDIYIYSADLLYFYRTLIIQPPPYYRRKKKLCQHSARHFVAPTTPAVQSFPPPTMTPPATRTKPLSYQEKLTLAHHLKVLPIDKTQGMIDIVLPFTKQDKNGFLDLDIDVLPSEVLQLLNVYVRDAVTIAKKATISGNKVKKTHPRT